jgi:ChpA-C
MPVSTGTHRSRSTRWLSAVVVSSLAVPVAILVSALPNSTNSRTKDIPTDPPSISNGSMVQAPTHLTIDVCGNVVDVVAQLNPTLGNTCISN